MIEKNSDDLDNLLAQWSDAHQPSAEHLAELSRRITGSLNRQPQQPSPSRNAESSAWYRSSGLVLSAAAVVLVLVSALAWFASENVASHNVASTKPEGTEPGGTRIAVVTKSDSNAVPIEGFSDEQRLQKLTLLSELDRMFADKRVWFAETDSDVVLGGDLQTNLSDLTAETPMTETPVAMRLVLAKRTSITSQWERVWAADVISRSDQVVRFLTDDPLQPAASFTAWTHLLPDGLVACEVDLKWDNGISAQLSDSLLLSPNGTTPGSSVSIDDVEYRLFHAVALLEETHT